MGVRHLWAGVVRSMALYGAPVWAAELRARRRCAENLQRVQRRLALRVIRGYRTISGGVAALLAGLPPLLLVAEELAQVYHLRRDLRRRGMDPPDEAVEAMRRQARAATLASWREILSPLAAGRPVVAALLPLLEEWLGRRWGCLTYRMTQVLAGHGCFGEYLCRMGKEPDPRCHACGDAQDTASHTLELCPAWDRQRRVLRRAVEVDPSFQALIPEMLRREGSWRAVASFCEDVILQKEAAGRERAGTASARRGATTGQSTTLPRGGPQGNPRR